MSMLTGIGLYIAGIVTGIFFYRNNVKSVAPFADQIDDIANKVKEKLEK